MRYFLFLSIAIAMVVLTCGIQAKAAAPIYSFETLYDPPLGTNPPQPDPAHGTRADAFHANGGGTTVIQDSIGATSGDHSLRFTMVGGATFSGAQSELIPAGINDPNTTALSLDVTIPANAFSGNFAHIGFKEFGVFNGDPMNPNQPLDAQSNIHTGEVDIALAPGTYHIQIPLIADTNPINGDSNVPLSAVYGPNPNTQGTPTSFEFYINKSNDSPLTVYLDNVMAVLASPPPLLGDTNNDGFVDTQDLANVENNLGTQGSGTLGDTNNDGFVDTQDLANVENNLGMTNHSELETKPSVASISSVPEPALMGFIAVGCVLALSRHRPLRRSRACA